MRRLLAVTALAAALSLSACGVGALPPRGNSVRQVLTAMPELLEFETAQVRQELYREIARGAELEAGNAVSPQVLFPISLDGRLVAAPALDPRVDLLQAPDAGTLLLDLGRYEWPEDRRESLQGLSEREVAELVSRSLLTQWKIAHGEGETILVERAHGAPYAAAYVDGILRINPAFLYLAAAGGPGHGNASP